MVWRQLPKLIPAGSIPVSRSKQKEQALRLFFLHMPDTRLSLLNLKPKNKMRESPNGMASAI